MVVFEQMLDDIFHMWRFPRTADADISHYDYRHVERALLEHPPVKKFIAQRRPTAINPGYGCEYCVNNFFDCAVHLEAKGVIRLQLLVQGTICCREIECALTLCGTYKVGLFRLLISLRSSC